MIYTDELKKMQELNKTVETNTDTIVSLAGVSIRELEKMLDDEDVTNLVDVITLLKIVLDKSLNGINDAVELGCMLDNLKRKNLEQNGYTLGRWFDVDWAYKDIK